MESRKMTSNKRMESDSLRRRSRAALGYVSSMKGHKHGCLSGDGHDVSM